MTQKSAENLKSFMDLHKLRVADFAKLAGISRFSVYNYLSGKNVRPEKARKIEKSLMEKMRVFFPWEKLVE